MSELNEEGASHEAMEEKGLQEEGIAGRRP
jgi:hypothetical protein